MSDIRLASYCYRRVIALAAALLSLATLSAAEPKLPDYPKPATPKFRVDAEGFGVAEGDIRRLLESAGREMWRFFPDYTVEPFVVTRGKEGPVVLYERNKQREIVMRLDTSNTYWAQYSFQFAHEFCHILSGYREGKAPNKWLEETLCEVASLYTLRAMAKSWETSPPYPHWKDYRLALKEYAQRRIDQYRQTDRAGVPAFLEKNEKELRANGTNREMNSALAIILLEDFEAEPTGWEAIRWINTGPRGPDDSLRTYLLHWRRSAPEKHRAFIDRIAGSLGQKLEP